MNKTIYFYLEDIGDDVFFEVLKKVEELKKKILVIKDSKVKTQYGGSKDHEITLKITLTRPIEIFGVMKKLEGLLKNVRKNQSTIDFSLNIAD